MPCRLLTFYLFLPLFLFACVAHRGKQPDTTLPRAAPSHLHWLRSQSMLAAAPELIAQVSQSERIWLAPSRPNRQDILLEGAPNWLKLPQEATPYFTHALNTLPTMAAAGLQGLYLGATGEKPVVWHNDKRSAKPASLQFDPAYGTEADYNRLAEKAEQSHIELGSTILGAATGMGPDFFLQARNAPEYGGLYAMLPVGPEFWHMLPSADEWEGMPLTPAQNAGLTAAGLLPGPLARDALAWAEPGGWAATGTIMGGDGMNRRWLYRYEGAANQPVLAWQDPSGSAVKLFSADIIRTTGLLGQSLAGLSLTSLMGLEPGPGPGLEPGLNALNALSSQIHRYGGWSLQADPAPISVMEAVLHGATDFCRDDITGLLVTYGYNALDGRPVAQLYRSWIEKDFPVHRLARGLNDGRPHAALLAERPEWTTLSAPDKMSETADFDWFLANWLIGLPGLVFYDRQIADPRVAQLLRARHASGLALGKPKKVVRGAGGGFGLLTSLPDGKLWLLACNFGRNLDRISISLPSSVTMGTDAATGIETGDLIGQNFSLDLDGHTAQNILFTKN